MILLTAQYWEIKTHKLKGRCIFATKAINSGRVIGDYIGKIINTAKDDINEKNGLYLLYYHDYASIYPEDITKPGIYLLNHSCEPNCWMYIYKGHTLFFTLRKIFPGEELTISYQLSPDDDCKPCTHVCHCQSQNCTGTMHLSEASFIKWNTFSENQAKQTKRKRVTYGKVLAKLTDYPQIIPDHRIYNLFGSTLNPPLILKQKSMPSILQIRRLIRKTGRSIDIPNLKTLVLGVQDDICVLNEYL